MMSVEEALISLGESPLNSSPYSKLLHTLLNAFLPGDEPVEMYLTGHEILSQIYKLPSHDLQERILQRRLGKIRGKDSYRTAVLVFSGFICIVSILLAVVEIMGWGVGGNSTLVETIVEGMFDVIKLLLTKE